MAQKDAVLPYRSRHSPKDRQPTGMNCSAASTYVDPGAILAAIPVSRRFCANPPPVSDLRLPAPGNIYATPLRFKLGGRPVLSAGFNVKTAGSERKRAEI
jgi:hypothetical protein